MLTALVDACTEILLGRLTLRLRDAPAVELSILRGGGFALKSRGIHTHIQRMRDDSF